MKKILINGEYQANTGFSCVVENIARILKADYEITILDYSKTHGYLYKIDDMNVIGRGVQSTDIFGTDLMISIMEGFDFIFLINDIWNIDEMLTKIKLSKKNVPKIVVYFPVDAEDHQSFWYKNLDIVDSVVTYTHFGMKVIKEAISNPYTGFSKEEHQNSLIQKISIIPHGIDKRSYFRMDNKNEVREKIFGTKKYNDSIIFLNANRNQPRKRLDISLLSFAEHRKNTRKDSYLWLHSAIVDCHIDTYLFAKRLGILENIIFSTTYEKKEQRPTFSTSDMNLVYNACDIGLNTSIGEGWGLCSYEHAHLGGVQIVPNHSANAEIYTEDESYMLIAKEPVIQDRIMTKGKVPSITNCTTFMDRICTLDYQFGGLDEKREKTIKRFNSDITDWGGAIKNAWLDIFGKIMQIGG